MANQSHIKIRIGAALDASVAAVFRQVEKRSEQSTRVIVRGNVRVSQASRQSADHQVKANERAQRQRLKALDAAAREERKIRERSARDAQRLISDIAKAQARAERQTTREATRESARRARMETRAARERDRFARRTSHRATRFFWPNAPIGSMASRVGGDLMRGAGVDFTMGGALGRNLAAQKQLTDLSNAAWIPGADGAAGQRVDPNTLDRESRTIARSRGIDSEQVRGGLQAYVKIAGDLEGARAIMGDLADLSVATGSDLEDVASAAAQVGEQLGNLEGEEKLRAINGILRTIAMQGKIGSIEMSDMSSQLARVAAAGGQFGGDVGKRMEQLSALMQIARKFGGAASPREAGTAVTSFVSTLNKNARVKQFQANGVNLRDQQGNLRDPLAIIKESIVAAKGDQVKLGSMFADVRGSRMVMGLANTYRKAGGAQDSAKGMEAVNKLLAENLVAGLRPEDIGRQLAAHLETGAAKATQAQEAWDQGLLSMRDALVTRMGPIMPKLEDFASSLGNVTTWIVDNPKQAIGAAMGISIARAGIESTMRASIEKAITGSGAGAALTGGIAKLFTGLAIAYATFEVGKAAINLLFGEEAQKQREAAQAEGKRGERMVKAQQLMRMSVPAPGEAGPVYQPGVDKARAELGAMQLEVEQRVAGVRRDQKPSMGDGMARGFSNLASVSSSTPGLMMGLPELSPITKQVDEAVAASSATNSAELSRLQTELVEIKALLSQPLYVRNISRPMEATE